MKIPNHKVNYSCPFSHPLGGVLWTHNEEEILTIFSTWSPWLSRKLLTGNFEKFTVLDSNSKFGDFV